jgi:SRSO17 transposase
MSTRNAQLGAMSYEMDEAGAARVAGYFNGVIGRHVPRRDQRASFATYAFGILADGERKSVEPIAARACADDEACERMHDRLLHFVREGAWSDRDVRREASRYAIAAMTAREPITCWMIDDTGMLKQGRHSPGVQRQYTGSAGKIANCQLAVSLSIASAGEQVPIDMALYLPESWTSDLRRRRQARIPDSIVFKTKIDLALELITRAVDDDVPGNIVLADSFYGRSYAFREAVRAFGLDYAVAVNTNTEVWLLDSQGRRRGDAQPVGQIGADLGTRAFRKITWREGTKRSLSSRFVFRRVKPAHDDGSEPASREPVWLVIEWPEGETRPTKFFLTTLRRRMSKKLIVRTIKERWKTERVYEELKGELGFDHYEGRSFIGWHHHVSVVLCCYAFIVAERVRAFPPSPERTGRHHSLAFAA